LIVNRSPWLSSQKTIFDPSGDQAGFVAGRHGHRLPARSAHDMDAVDAAVARIEHDVLIVG
jgi:hypothetical protein